MIYTITPNPALDLGGVVERLVPNEKAYVHSETRFPGGNGINAARIIHKFGLPVIAGGFLGGGIGQEVKTLLKKEGVRCQFIQIQGDTRMSVTVSNQKTHLQTRLSFPGPTIQPQEALKLVEWLKKISPPSLIVIGGSLPPGFSMPYLRQIIQSAHHQGIRCIVDIPGAALKKVISCHPLLIKPNLIEFQELIGKKVNSIQAVTKEAKKMNSKVPFVCISSVEKGALLVTAQGVWFGQIPPVQVKTSVGAGDSMVGAMSAQISHHDCDGANLLRWGLAAATATLLNPGTQLGDFKDTCRFYRQIKIIKL